MRWLDGHSKARKPCRFAGDEGGHEVARRLSFRENDTGAGFAPDKSVNGKAARTISPACGMSTEIGALVPRFDVGVGVEVRLRG